MNKKGNPKCSKGVVKMARLNRTNKFYYYRVFFAFGNSVNAFPSIISSTGGRFGGGDCDRLFIRPSKLLAGDKIQIISHMLY